MYVANILKAKGNEIMTISPSEPIAAALEILGEKRIGALLVLDGNGRIAGILSERDLVQAMQKHHEKIFEKRVSDLMTTRVVTCSSKDPVAAIMGMMTAQRFRHVPVVDDGKLVGIISIGDVVKSRIEEAEAEVDALRQYISL